MSFSDEHEEIKVQKALDLLRSNPDLSIVAVYRETRIAYYRVMRRRRGILRLSSRGGYNKKLDVPSTKALREYLLIYYSLGRPTSIDNTIKATNSIL